MFSFFEKFLKASFVLSYRRNPLDPFSERFRIRRNGDPYIVEVFGSDSAEGFSVQGCYLVLIEEEQLKEC